MRLEILAKARKRKTPIVDDNFNLVGLITIKDIEKTIKYPLSAKDAQGRLLCGAGVGITANVLDRVGALVDAKVDVVVLDSGHGHSENVLRCLRMIKEKYPDLQVIAGNVATGEGTRDLIEAGADAVKVGIGPGSICTTRVVAGIGVPTSGNGNHGLLCGCQGIWDSDYCGRRYQVFRRYDKGHRSRRQCLHDGKYLRRLRRKPGNL